MQNWGCSRVCHLRRCRCVCPPVLPLPKVCFLSFFGDAIISLWESFSWHSRNNHNASNPHHTNLGHTCHQWLRHCYGISKTTAVTISKKSFLLNSLGVVDVLWDDVLKETTDFMLAAYSGSGVTMSECRQLLWVQKAARFTGTPKLSSLPPTTNFLWKTWLSTLPSCRMVFCIGFRATTFWFAGLAGKLMG